MTRTDVPRQVVYQWVRTGQVRVNRGRAKPSYRLRVGDDVRIPPHRPDSPISKDAPAPDIPVAVLHEDDDLLIVNKPAGLAVHGGSQVRFGLIDVLRQQRPEGEFLELAHRLDRGQQRLPRACPQPGSAATRSGAIPQAGGAETLSSAGGGTVAGRRSGSSPTVTDQSPTCPVPQGGR